MKRPADLALAAGEAGAADDGRADDVEERARRRRSSAGRRRGGRSRGSTRPPRRSPEKTKTRMMTRRTGTPEISAAFGVAADGVDVAAEDGAAAAGSRATTRERQRDHHRVGDEGEDVAALDRRLDLLAEIERDQVARAEPRELRRQVDDVLRLREPDPGRREQHQRDQRHHEGRHPEAGDEVAVEEADQAADGEHDDHARRRPNRSCPPRMPPLSPSSVPQSGLPPSRFGSARRRHHDRAGDADEAHDRALAEVDAHDDDDEGLADRDGEQRPDVGELVADVAGGDEVGEEDRHRQRNRRWSDRG